MTRPSSGFIETVLRVAGPEAARIPRFRGRADILWFASDDDQDAIRTLSLSAPERERAAVRGDLPPHIVKALDLEAVRLRDEKRDARTEARERNCDRLASRLPGNVPGRALRRIFAAALKTASFRGATHSHDVSVVIVARGEEGVRSSNGRTNPSSLGLPNAYARKGFFVTTSEHAWSVSADFFKVPPADRAGRGWLQLSPTVLVRQGRGTALVCERSS